MKEHRAYLQYSPKEHYFLVTSNFFFFFLGLHLWHMEVPKLGVELELQLLATPQPQQRQI